jgi:N-acetylneuraminic acid mutarotase
MKITTFISLIVSLFACFVMKAEKTQILGTWKKIGYLPGQVQMHVMLAAKGYLYVIGGRASYGWRTVRSHVFFARIKKDGSLGKWQKTTPLPQAVAGHAGIVFGKHIYAISGKGHGSDNIMKQSVSYIGTIKDDGSIGSWRPASSLPKDAFYRGEAVLHNKTIYYVGGFYSRMVFRTQIQENGLLGEWKQEKKMISPKMYFGLAVWNEALYVLGGNRAADGYVPLDAIISSQIKADGNLGPWRRNSELPEPNSGFSFAQTNETVFLIGGKGPRDTVWRSSFNSEGELVDWHKEKPFPTSVANGTAVIYNNYIYQSGGIIKLPNGKLSVSPRVYMAKINKMDK